MTDVSDTQGNGWSFPFFAGCRTAPMTVTLMALSVVVALISTFGSNRDVLTWLTFADLRGFDHTVAGGLSSIGHGQVWRLITPIFIHFGFLHILFNLLWLWDLGGAIERRWSSKALLVLVAILALAANTAQFCINWDLRFGLSYANALFGGMSGVVYGFLGYVWIRGRFDPTSGIQLHQKTVIMMMVWLVLCCTGILGHIGNSAHIIGLLVGSAWGWHASHRHRISTSGMASS